MNLIVEKTRKNDVFNTNGVLAAAHVSFRNPQLTCQSRQRKSALRGRAEVARPPAMSHFWASRDNSWGRHIRTLSLTSFSALLRDRLHLPCV
jgi:hypothetical protein